MTVLVSCSKTLLTHQLDNPNPTITLNPHKGTINSAVWSHNNQVIATCGSDGKVVLSHATKGNTLLTLDDENSKAQQVNSVWFTSNSNYLASGGNDGIFKIWDIKNRKLHASQKYHFASITSVHWNMDDSIAASSSLTGDIVLHNAKFNTQTANFNQKGSNGIKMIKFSPLMPNCIASAGIDGSVVIWDINTRQSTAQFSNHSSRVNAVCFSNFNPVLMCSASLDQNVNFYDIREKKVVKTLNTDAPLTALGFHNDGHTITVGTLYGGLYVYDLKAAGTVKTHLKGHENNQVNFVDFVRGDENKASNSMIDEEKDINKRSSSSNYIIGQEMGPSSKKSTPSSTDLSSLPKNFGPGQDLTNIQTTISNRNSAGKPPQSTKILEEPKFGMESNEQKQPFLDINNIRRQVSDKTKQKESEKLLSSIGSANSSSMQTEPLSNQMLSNPDTFKIQSDLSKKVFENMSTLKKSPDAMNIEVPKNLSGFNSQIMDKVEERSNVLVSKVDGSKDFTSSQKDFIQDCFKEQNNFFRECLFDLQGNISDGVANLHLEVIRQFEIQKNELDAKLDRYFSEFNMMFQRNEEMRRENERLKKTSF